MFWKTEKRIEGEGNHRLERTSPKGLFIVHIFFFLYYILFLYVGKEFQKSIPLFPLILWTFFPMIFFYFFLVRLVSKEVFILENGMITIKKYCFLFCYKKQKFRLEDVKLLCYKSKKENFGYSLFGSWNFRVKITPYEDVIYSFGKRMKEDEGREFFDLIESLIEK